MIFGTKITAVAMVLAVGATSRIIEQQENKSRQELEIDLGKVYFNGPNIGTVFAKAGDHYVGIRLLDSKRCKLSVYDAESNVKKKRLKAIDSRKIELTFNRKKFTTHDGKSLTVSGQITFLPGKPENKKNFWFTTDDTLLLEMLHKNNIEQLPKSFSVKFKKK